MTNWKNHREATLRLMEQDLHLWNLKLDNNRDEAEREVRDKLLELAKAGFNRYDLMQANARMLNGSVTPRDYRGKPARIP